MRFAAAHSLCLRLFCALLAAFWAGMILLGSAGLAGARSTPRLSCRQPASAAQPVRRCPMCAGRHMGGMPCCCHALDRSFVSCLCSLQPRPDSTEKMALLVWWSPQALLPAALSIAGPVVRTCVYPAFSSCFEVLRLSPLPRPPRLL